MSDRRLTGRAATIAGVAVCIAAVLGFYFVGPGLRLTDDSNPNILLLIADDLGVDWAPCYSDNGLMPNIERLCSQGVAFDRAYATPSCAPSRATILTGRYALRTRAGATTRKPDDPPNYNLALEENIIPELLDQINGVDYRHAAFGKWHLSDTFNGGRKNPILAGFQNYYGTMDFSNYFKWPKNIDGEIVGEVEKYKTTAFVDDAMSWIGETGDQPWFAYVAFYNVHSPWHLPPNDLHDYDHLDPKTNSQETNPADYFPAMLQALDAEIGRLLEYVETNVQRDTYIIFIGDNGTSYGVALPDLGTNKFKSTINEGGIHVPLVISGPDIADPGRRVTSLANSTDLFSTIIELAGGESIIENSEVTLDSESLLPYLFDSKAQEQRAWAFSDAGNNHRKFRHAVIMGDYKLIVQSDSLRLFDLKEDPYEELNLVLEDYGDQDAISARILFSKFIDLYRSESDPYTDVNIESLTTKYQDLLCSNVEGSGDLEALNTLRC